MITIDKTLYESPESEIVFVTHERSIMSFTLGSLEEREEDIEWED